MDGEKLVQTQKWSGKETKIVRSITADGKLQMVSAAAATAAAEQQEQLQLLCKLLNSLNMPRSLSTPSLMDYKASALPHPPKKASHGFKVKWRRAS